jgi:hypothetical protein
MGANPRVFKGDGALCEAGGWHYNSGSASGMSIAVYGPAAKCGHGNYYSSGLTQAYNGAGYYTYSSFNSPDLGL